MLEGRETIEDKSYRGYPIIFISFLKVAVAFTLELSIPLYYIQEGLDPSIIGIIVSATSMIYLFSPLILNRFYLKIGLKRSLLISVIGTLIIQIIFQFSLNSALVYVLLIFEGFFAGLFWPVLITNISLITGSKEYCEDDSSRDKLMRFYNGGWNSGAVFSYLVGTVLLFLIENLRLIFLLTLIYSIILFLFTLLFEDPKSVESLEFQHPIKTSLETQCKKEKIEFPRILPLYLIGFYGFLIGALLLIYPIKSEQLSFFLYTTYLLNFFRMTAQTISITESSKLSIKRFKYLIMISLIILVMNFVIFSLNTNILIFGILFIMFGIFGSTLYSFSFKLIIYRNIKENTSKYSSYFETLAGLGFFLSPIIVGFIAEFNVDLAFIFLTIISSVTLIFFISIMKKIKSY
jgi:MFS family permease